MGPTCSRKLRALLALLAVHLARSDQRTLDCPLRQAAIDYAQKIQPSWRPLSAFQELADALNGAEEATDCHVKPNASLAPGGLKASRVKLFPLPSMESASLVLYVDAHHGDDDRHGDGSRERPFQSIHRAVGAVRAARGSASHHRLLSEKDRAVLVLRAGVFHLGAKGGTLQLGAADSFLTISAFPGEDAVISGGVPLETLKWEAVPKAIPKRTLYEYRSGMLGKGFDAAPPALMTVTDAQAKCSAMPSCAGITYQNAAVQPTSKVKVYFKHETFWTKSSGWSTYVRNVGYEPGAANLYRADVSSVVGLGDRPIDSLRIHGVRAVRARYPNVKSVEQMGAMQIEADTWTPQSSLNLSKLAAYTFEPPTPLRNDTAQGFFQHFKLGVGGDCALRFTPQASYWCSKDSQGGGPGPYSAPVGMTVTNANTSLPHTPYGSSASGTSPWVSSPATNPPLIHTWRAGRWFSWVMQLSGAPRYDASTGQSTFDFSLRVGGNQGSRGGDAGQEMFVENVFDELDAPGEFFFDPARPGTGKPTLWLWHNASGGTPPPATGLVAPTLAVLINASGTNSAPITGLSFEGVTFRDAAPTYLEPHGTPSGGEPRDSRPGRPMASCVPAPLCAHLPMAPHHIRSCASQVTGQ